MRKKFYVVLLLSAGLQVQGYKFLFVNYSNLFRQVENCYRFSDSPPPPASSTQGLVQCDACLAIAAGS